MKNRLVIICFFLFYLVDSNSQSINYSVAPEFDQSNNIRQYLNKCASDITNKSLANINNLNDWKSVRDQRHQEFIEMMGLQDYPIMEKRLPPKVTITGVIQKEGYRIEKLYYESSPNLFVPANLYIPDGIKKPVPAILYVNGHAETQKHHYQAHAKSFALNGFVCLIIETIQRGEVEGEHLGQESKGWFNWYSRGYNPGGVEIWNGIRGLDLLSELSEVDKNRLGVTGISGGGSQSWYLPAIDLRVKAVAAVAGGASVEGQIIQKTIDDHCDCMMPINTYGIDFSDIGALIAPRSFIIAQPTRDLYYSIEAVQSVYNKVKTIYNYYGMPQNVILAEATGGHSYGTKEELRPKILSFFLKELMGKDISPEDLDEIDISKELPNEDLMVYINGAPKEDVTKTIQDSFVELASPPEIKNIQGLNTYRDEVIDFLKLKTFRAFPKEPVCLNIRLDFQSVNGIGNKREDYSFVSEEGWRLKVSLRKSQLQNKPKPFLLVLKNPNQERYASESLTSGVRSKINVAYFEARGIGDTEWSQSLQWNIRRSAAWTGRTIASMRVYDVMRCLEALRKIPSVDPDNISIIAQGEMATIAMYAALLDGNVKTLIIKDPDATQDITSQENGRGKSIEMLNVLRITDLPQVAGLMFPNKLVTIGKTPNSYRWTEKLYKKLKKPNYYIEIEKISEWLND